VPTALVTGAAGFIGSYLTERLVQSNYDVVALDSLLWGEQRIERLLRGRQVLLERGDVRDESLVARIAALGPFDTVYHLAALAYIPYCANHSVETISVNVLGTQVLLEALTSLPPHRIIFASSGDVYAPKNSAHLETDPVEPATIYGVSKAFGERLMAAAATKMPGTSFVVARLFNVYGSRGSNPYVIPSIVAQLKQGSQVQLGSTWPRRDFIQVRDIAEALLALSTYRENEQFECFNIGTGDATSIKDVISALEELLGSKILVRADEERVRPLERPHLQASIEKLKEATSWVPQYSLMDGLRELCIEAGLVKT
jgi:UDP-glucose 4-epimerase